MAQKDQQQAIIASYSNFNSGYTQCRRCKIHFFYSVSKINREPIPRMCSRCQKELDMIPKPTKEELSVTKEEKITIALCATFLAVIIGLLFLKTI